MAEASLCTLNCLTSSREAVSISFYSFWFDPTRNRPEFTTLVADALSTRLLIDVRGSCFILIPLKLIALFFSVLKMILRLKVCLILT